MALLRLVVCCLSLAVTARGVEIRFVPPVADGAVSLGIYDSSGNLVRVLGDDWPFHRFSVGLNGLSTGWDGNDAAGRPVQTGTYEARGFVVGDGGVEGEAFHFNDWIVSTESPRIVSVGAVGFLPGGDLILAARLAGDTGSLLRYGLSTPEPWAVIASERIPDVAGAVRMAVAAGRVFVLMGDRLRAVELATGKEVSLPTMGFVPEGVSAHGGRIAVLSGAKMFVFDALNLTRQSELILPGTPLAETALLAGGAAVAVGKDGSLWHRGKSWRRIETPGGTEVRFVAAGKDGTFWTLEKKPDGSVMAVQYSAEEGRLAEWSAAPGGEPAGLAASSERDAFCAVLASPAAQRTVAIQRGASGSWELVADKTITVSTSFGTASGRLSPSSGELPSEIVIDLAENPLDPKAPRKLAVRAAVLDGGTGLATAEGLPLVRVSGQPHFSRLMVLPGAVPGTAMFYQGDGACVEQYTVTGLDSISAFDAGKIEMEAGAEKPPPSGEEEPEARP